MCQLASVWISFVVQNVSNWAPITLWTQMPKVKGKKKRKKRDCGRFNKPTGRKTTAAATWTTTSMCAESHSRVVCTSTWAELKATCFGMTRLHWAMRFERESTAGKRKQTWKRENIRICEVAGAFDSVHGIIPWVNNCENQHYFKLLTTSRHHSGSEY